MLSYAIFLLILFGGVFLIETIPNAKNKPKKQLIYAAVVIVLFWGSLDAPKFATDIMNYYNNATKAMHTGFQQYLASSPFEKGYAAFIWLVTYIFKTPQALLFVQTAFVTFSVFRFIYRNSKDVFVSLITYICLGSFGMFSYAFRQAFAIAVCLFALEAIQKKKRILAVIIILFASLFHQTAIVFLPVVFLYNRKLSQKNIVLVSVLMLLMVFTLDKTLPQANEFFEMDYGVNHRELSIVGGILNVIIYTIGFILVYLKYRRTPLDLKQKEFRDLSIFVFLCIIAFVIYACRFYALAMERVAYYFLPAFCILFAEGLTNHKKERLPDMFAVFFFLSVFLFLYRSDTSLGNYNSIWW